MIRTTPFYERLDPMNRTGLYGHWSGYLSALKYDMSAKDEYFAIRNSAGLFDTSPLFKYWIRGKDAERFLAGVLTRDIRLCRPGRAQYTVWCDDGGYVLEDGVFFRHSETEFFLTAARPNLGYLADLVGRLDVQIEDVSEDFGVLAVQGPRSRDIVATLTPDVAELPYFGLRQTKIGSAPVTVSRTGYTGDLGFEIYVGTDDAIPVLDAVLEAGAGRGLRPFGEEALLMARIEAGLVLIDVEFGSSRLAFNDHERITPKELGFGWMLRGIEADDRPFIGRNAIRRELAEKTSRWAMVGLLVDWQHYARLYNDAGLIPPKDETPLSYESMLYDDDGNRIGYATSLMYSPMLQRHIAMARVRPDCATLGARVNLEVTINHEYQTVGAEVARLPLFNPSRKTA
ncbi:MAG: aminomethyl transferase family protein [Nocardioidaceae bacterium]|nr:aminomethyl transferase family protein [Nocardioidaceae bacterium]